MGRVVTKEELDQAVAEAVKDGWEVVQRGRIKETGGATFSDRADGFQIALLGVHAPPRYRPQFGGHTVENRLLDTDDEWVHLRRPWR